jgi:hypothetical protein
MTRVIHAHRDEANAIRSPRVWGWVGAVVALASSAVHLPMLGNHSWVASTIVAAMLIGCAHCSICLFRSPTAGAWLRTGGMGVAMLALHPVLMAAMSNTSMPGMDSPAMGSMHSMPSMDPWMSLMLVLAAAEIAVAAVALGLIAMRTRVVR